MKTPLRILRAIAQDLPGVCPEPTPRDQARRQSILTAATAMMAERGPHTVTLTDIAAAVGIPRGTIRYIFPDLDNLLATIIRDHLRQISSVIGDARRAIAAGSTVQATSRAAYITATRTGLGGFLPAHVLTVSYRHLLPPDELEGVDQCRNAVAYLVGGPDPLATLDLLDNFRFTLNQVEAMLATVAEMAEPSWEDGLPPPRPKTRRENEDEKPRAVIDPPSFQETPPLPRTLPVQRFPDPPVFNRARAGP